MDYEDFSHYNIYRTSSKILPYTYLVKTQATSYEDLVNDNGKEYYYRVTAVDRDGLESAKQEPIIGSTLSAPAAPASISAHFDGGAVNISWSSSARANSYTLYREGGGSERTINDIAGTSYTDTSVQTGASYTYRVIAVDQFGIGSDKSDSVSVSVK